MSPQTWVFVAYFVVVFAIGWYSLRATRGEEDYWIAGGDLGWFTGGATMAATHTSAGTFVGTIGVMYTAGWSFGWVLLSIPLSYWFMVAVLAPRFTRQKELTIPAFIERRYYGRGIRGLSAAIILVATVVYIQAQIVAAGLIGSTVFSVQPVEAMIGFTAILLVYTVVGGMIAVVYTDAFQLVVMALGALFAVPLALRQVGGLSGLLTLVEAAHPLVFTWETMPATLLLTMGLSFFLGGIAGPEKLIRLYAMKDMRTIRRGVLFTIVTVLTINLLVFVLALAAIVLFPNLPTGDLAMPMVARAVLPTMLGAIMLAAITAAMMSTVDSLLIVLGAGGASPARRGGGGARPVHRPPLHRAHGGGLRDAGGRRRAVEARHEGGRGERDGGRRHCDVSLGGAGPGVGRAGAGRLPGVRDALRGCQPRDPAAASRGRRAVLRALTLRRGAATVADTDTRSNGATPTMRFRLSLLVLLALVVVVPSGARAQSVADRYRDVANRIIDAATGDHDAYARLTELVDQFPARITGSTYLEQAIDWILVEMEKDGLDNVHGDATLVENWVRGEESLHMVLPRPREVPMLGLGGSVATPPGGIRAEVMAVGSFDELAERADEAPGKIVLFDVPFTSYGETVQYRTNGAVAAARVGAAASLIRSVTPYSQQTPHTGNSDYVDGVPRIPHAAITVEDAEWIHRMLDRGERVELHLRMTAQTLPDAVSRNVMGEIRGSELPDEVVVFGGHIDSWDVGQGAMDDGGGVVVAWEALRILKELGLRPRRTIRAVGWTSEENGGPGGRQYVEDHGQETHVLAMESDGGVFQPQGFGFTGPDEAFEIMTEIGTLLDGLGSGAVTRGGGGADIGPLMQTGVPGAGLNVDGTRYFWYHHTDSDTIDKLDPDEVAACVATMAVFAYVVADMPERLPR